MAKYEMFTPEQAKAVSHFLVFAAEREDEWKRESEQLRQEGEKYRIERDLPKNKARRALEQYWGQFL